MTTDMQRKPWGLITVVGIVGALVGGGVVFLAKGRSVTSPVVPMPTPASMVSAGPVTLSIAPEVAAKAGIEVGSATAGTPTRVLQVPGHVEPNAYSQVMVTATATGRIGSMTAELGQHVKRGAVIGQLFAPEIA